MQRENFAVRQAIAAVPYRTEKRRITGETSFLFYYSGNIACDISGIARNVCRLESNRRSRRNSAGTAGRGRQGESELFRDAEEGGRGRAPKGTRGR